MKAYKLILFAGTLSAALMVSACDPTTPSQVNLSKLKVKDQTVTETYSADHVDIAHVKATAHNVLLNGNKDVALTVPYLPGNSAAAARLGAAYQKAFAAQGVTHISVALVVMKDSQDVDKAVVSYKALAAVQPNDCGRIPGYQGTDTLDAVDQYQFGCETQASLGKMVEDPSDLLGKASRQDADSRRNGAIIDPYAVGTPNQPMKGFSASDIGK
jgi:pilus biogenesis lipoprotein CpaD